jgi:L-fuculose-phosphate aldolase
MSLAEFQMAGRALSAAGLADGSSGNLSLRQGGGLIITRSGSSLANLEPSDLVLTGLLEDYITSSQPSSELEVHRAILRAGSVNAVVHAHLPWALSLAQAAPALPGGEAVIGAGGAIMPGAFAHEIAAGLAAGGLVMVRGHGSFAAAATMAKACRLTLDFENTCRRACAGLGIQPAPATE